MQPVLDCNQSIRMSDNNTFKKSKLFSLCPRNETDKTENFLDFMLEKNQ